MIINATRAVDRDSNRTTKSETATREVDKKELMRHDGTCRAYIIYRGERPNETKSMDT